MMHYAPKAEGSAVIERSNLLLNDSGGQYLTGTTDTTRTFAMGPVTDEERRDYTLTLKSVIAVSTAVFKEGMTGYGLDILARGGLWKYGLDYRCGTGHGVGYLLNVHESPNGFRWKMLPNRNEGCVLEEGMLTSDEPGVYLTGKFGIRHENLMVCMKGEKNEYGQFMYFDTVTLVPFDLDGVDPTLMTAREKQLLNDYHQKIYAIIGPHLNAEEQAWLKEATRAI